MHTARLSSASAERVAWQMAGMDWVSEFAVIIYYTPFETSMAVTDAADLAFMLWIPHVSEPMWELLVILDAFSGVPTQDWFLEFSKLRQPIKVT